MQLKPITTIAVLLILVVSLSVAGCTSSSSSSKTVSTDYPTSGRSKLIEGAIEQVRPSDSSSSEWKTQVFHVMWLGDTEAAVLIEQVNTKSFDKLVYDYTFTHWQSTSEANAYFYKNKHYTFGDSWNSPPIDYYKLTGKVPTVFNVNRDSWGLNGIAQYDTFVVEKHYELKK